MTGLPPVAVGTLVALLLAAAMAAFRSAFGPPPRRTRPGRRISTSFDTAALLRAIVVGLVVLMITRWPVLAVVAAVLSLSWRMLLDDSVADSRREHVEAIAKWLEDLRDTLRASALTVDEALEHVARRPPPALAEPFAQYLHYRRLGFRTEDALGDLATTLAHPLSDAAVGALRLVIGGSTGAGRLHATVSALAAAARDEVTARERIDRTRAVYRSSMKRLVVIAAFLVGYLRLAGGDLLSPYATPVGQVVLMLPLAMWGGCVMWLHRLCDERRITER